MGFLYKFQKAYPYYLLLAASIGSLAGIVHNHNEPDPIIVELEERARENQELFPDIYDNYQKYFDAIANEISICSDDRDIIKDFALYNTLLHNGYISLGDYDYTRVNVEFNDLFGANIAVGEGVCVNSAYNLYDVFTSLGYECRVVVGKYYEEGKEIPEYNNHAIVYVSDGNKKYLLDATNKTIFLRKGYMKYCSMHSIEDKYTYFEPCVDYKNEKYGEIYNYQLLYDFNNNFDEHKKIYNQYQDYRAEALDYATYFQLYEHFHLYSYEKAIESCLDESFDKGYNLK